MELMRCDQLAAWCKQYEKASVKEEAPKTDVSAGGAELDGMVALKKPDIEGEDDVFATSRKKGTRPLFRLVVYPGAEWVQPSYCQAVLLQLLKPTHPTITMLQCGSTVSTGLKEHLRRLFAILDFFSAT